MSLSSESLNKIRKMAQEVAEREGCILYDLEMVGQGKARILRVYIDKLAEKPLQAMAEVSGDKPNSGGTGASIDDCANVSRSLGLMLDVDDVVGDGAYDLEVSTPGLERQLKETWHFENALGKQVQINAREELPCPEGIKVKKAPKSIQGKLNEVESEHLGIESNEVVWRVPRAIIHKAKLIYVFEHPGAKKASGPKKGNKKSKR